MGKKNKPKKNIKHVTITINIPKKVLKVMGAMPSPVHEENCIYERRLAKEWEHIQKYPKMLPDGITAELLEGRTEEGEIQWHIAMESVNKDSPHFGKTFDGILVFPREYPFQLPRFTLIQPLIADVTFENTNIGDDGRIYLTSELCGDDVPWNPATGISTFLVDAQTYL